MMWDHGGSNPWEKPGTPNFKTEQWLVSSGNQEPQTTWTLSVTCQIDIVNKQLVRPFNWNKPFSKTYLWLTDM